MKRGDLITAIAPGDYGKPRPALVIQSDLTGDTASVAVLLLTSDLMDAPFARWTVEPDAQNGLRTTSQVQIDKILSIPRRRLGPTIGHLDEEAMVGIGRLLASFLGIA